MSAIEIGCPHCGQELVADSSLAGTNVECPSCGQEFKVGKRSKKASGRGIRSVSRSSGTPKRGNARTRSGTTTKRTRPKQDPPPPANVGDLWTNPIGWLSIGATFLIVFVLMRVFDFEFRNKAVLPVIALGIYGVISSIISKPKGK